MSNSSPKQEITLAQLAKRIEDQGRFTRTIIISCTLGILALFFYAITEIYTTLPQAVVLHYMANVEPIVREWRIAESNLNRQEAAKAKH